MSGSPSASGTKWLITLGILLPLLAALLGVAAWSVSSNAVHSRASYTSEYTEGGRSAFRDVFEERNDEKVPIGGALGEDVLLEEDAPPSSPEQRDPLYVVHYVRQDATSEKPADLMAKILHSNRGTGQGNPQFIVFASTLNGDEDTSMPIERKRRKKYGQRTYGPTGNEVTVSPRNFLDSSDYMQPQPQPQQQQQPCCGNGMMSTEAPKSGLTISLGQVPLGPLGVLRQILRPKVDLKKKVFFGVQLENGVGFGGQKQESSGGTTPGYNMAQQQMHAFG